ncbi:MAG: zinc ribbon domain-containing protein [Syntrophomonadaceae bacterium]|jgi:regulator of replication initiation timing|nr:zinc ribbon domain-containing protein [Syntrophomonadaceae bacterium]
MKYCHNCGTKLRDESKVCWECGTNVDREQEQEQLQRYITENGQLAQKLQVADREYSKLKTWSVSLEKENVAFKAENKILKEAPKNRAAAATDNQKTRSTRTVVCFLIALVIIIYIAVGKYSDLSDDYNFLNYEKQNLQRIYDDSKKLLMFTVDSVKVGNANSSNNWINQPGETLYADRIRYLNPVMYIDSQASATLTFFIKIISPSGTLMRNEAISPDGYSFSKSKNIRQGNDLLVDFDGWGAGDHSMYEQGDWDVEVWYNDVCIGQTIVTLQ